MKQCVFCHAENDESRLICQKCEKIMPAPSGNAFEVLQLPIGFDVDSRALDVAYFARLAQVHPDKFKGKSEKEQVMAHESAAMVIRAYEVLKSKYTRVQELLRMASIDPDTGIVDQGFLVEAMEWREALADADDNQVVELASRAKEQLAKCWLEIERCFIDASDEHKDWHKINDLLAKIRFIWRFVDEIGR